MPDAAPAAQTPAGSTATRSDPATSPPPAALPARGTVLGFDFGLARIGVATGELETGQASALATVHDESNDARFKAIAALIAEWHPVALVVGLQGSGDSLRSSPFTDQSMRAMLQNLGISTQGGQSNAKNVAAVMVMAASNRIDFSSPIREGDMVELASRAPRVGRTSVPI